MTLLLLAYFLALLGLALFGLHRLLLLEILARLSPSEPAPPPADVWPGVVVQLPIYNEAFVAERVIRAAARLRYPGPLAIQVLDDSTDATIGIVDGVAAELSAHGLWIEVLRRGDRTGYKAGALAHGLAASDAPLVAIFDADFLPPPEFLLETVPALLADPKIGMVQTRWSFTNRTRSALTRAQAVFLDAHFGIEHAARAAAGHCFNFNGTAGIWKRAAIVEAGGWRADTLTEDLDLSYRAQLAGWRFAYLDRLGVPGELPESFAAFRAQQARWVRGSVETLRQQAGAILRAPWSRRKKLEAWVHLGSNLGYLAMAVLAALLPATVVLRDRFGWMVPGGQRLLSTLDLLMLSSGTLAMLAFYWVSIRRAPGAEKSSLLGVLFALALGAGMSLSNAREVILGALGPKAEFVRTPKRGEADPAALARTYRAPRRRGMLALEGAFALYHALGLVYVVESGLWGAAPFLSLYLVGFLAAVLVDPLTAIAPKAPITSARSRSPA